MGYRGQTLSIDCSRGGFSGMPNAAAIDPMQMVWPTRNINVHNGVREKRGGTSLIYAAALSGTPQIMGLYDFVMRDGTRFTIAATKDGKIYKDDTNTIKTGLSTTNRFSFETGEDKLFATDQANPVQVWNGAAASSSNLASPPADWTTNPPFQLLRHGRGASQRMWGVNASGLYASITSDMEDFLTSGTVYIPIDTGPGEGIVGAVEYGNRLIAFSRRQSYPIDDTDSDIANWGYEKAIYSGGVAHHRLIAVLPNDFVCMMEDGEIYSGTAVQSYGDYKVASITRPSWMHKWIQQNVRLSYIDHFHCTVDPVLRCIKFFVVRNGQTTVDTALCYFYDRDPAEAWQIHDSTAGGYNASCSALFRKAAGDFKVYTGDYAGKIFELETANANDNGAAYYGGFTTPIMNLGDGRRDKRIDSVRVLCQPQGDYVLQGKVFVDGKHEVSGTFSMAGIGGVLGSMVLGTDVLGGTEIIDPDIEVESVGKRCQVELYNSGLNQKFSISEVQIDFKPLGAEQK